MQHYLVCLQKNNKNIFILLFVLLNASFMLSVHAQQKVNKKEAAQWMLSGDWQKNLQLKPHPSINAVIFQQQYNEHKDWWKKAFAFLGKKDISTLPDGTYPIVGKNVFASISSYAPVAKEEKQWEAHRQYADIQMVISGKEIIGKADVSQLKITRPYNKETDNESLKGEGDFYVAEPGIFFIFFPGDAHLPGLKVSTDQKQKVKKIVIKVRVN